MNRNIHELDGVAPAKRGRRLPVVMSVGEVRLLLAHMRGVPRLCATLMYGSGLRLGECVSLRVKDVDLERGEMVVRCGKGDKDRRVPFPAAARRPFAVQVQRVERNFARDRASGVRSASLQPRQDCFGAFSTASLGRTHGGGYTLGVPEERKS